MYHPGVIQRKIAEYEKNTGKTLVYHSVAEVIEANKRFKSYEWTDDKGSVFAGLEKYTQADHDWIDNEYTLCAYDFEYWATRYAFIDVQGVLRRFTFRKSQRILLKLWAKREILGFEIAQIILKARQQGISTLVELALTHRSIFKRNRKVAVSSAKDEQSVLMNMMMQTTLNELPFWMKPELVSSREGSRYVWNTGTRLNVYTGRGVTGIAQGDSPTDIHLSEVCYYPNPMSLIEKGLFKAVHPSPEIFMILESTGDGNVGWWPETWYHSRDNWASKRARLEPVFFPWFMADDLFPTETWRLEHPLPKSWKPIKETQKMMDKCAAYVANTPLMAEELGKGWKLPRHQAYWWELQLLEARSKQNGEKEFREQMPCDDIEALQPKKNLVFSAESIESALSSRERFYTAWAITGEQILDKHHPFKGDIDYDAERFRVQRVARIRTIRGWEPKTLVWEFIPLYSQEDGLKLFDSDRKLLVFEGPEPGFDYTIGVDTARAMGEDASSISVMRRARNGNEPDVQVAEFNSKFIDSAELHAFVLAIATWYGTYMNGQEPLVAAEQVLGPGDNVQLQMKMHGYRRFFKFSRLDGKDPIKDQKKATREGWFTNVWSRPFMLDRFKSAFENGWLILNSPFLLQNEMSPWIVDTAGGRARYDHESGKHDDRIFSMAIAFIIANSTEAMSERIVTRFVPEPDKIMDIDFSPLRSFTVSYSTLATGRGGFFNL